MRKRDLGTEAAWNDQNKEMTRDEFQAFVEKKIQDGIEPTKVVMEMMMLQNVSLDDLTKFFNT